MAVPVEPSVRDAVRRGVTGLLGVEVREASPARVELAVDVDERLHQPYGLLHGGVSALLAETAASLGASLAAQPGVRVVGIELNASHLRAMREGELVAVATPLRIGRSVQVWDITLRDGSGRDICRSRCTVATLPEPPPGTTPGTTSGASQ